MSSRSAARGKAAANSIRLTSRTSKAVATSRASPSRCFLFCRGSRAARSAPIAAATVAIPPISKPPQARRIPFKHRKVQRARKSDGWQGEPGELLGARTQLGAGLGRHCTSVQPGPPSGAGPAWLIGILSYVLVLGRIEPFPKPVGGTGTMRLLDGGGVQQGQRCADSWCAHNLRHGGGLVPWRRPDQGWAHKSDSPGAAG